MCVQGMRSMRGSCQGDRRQHTRKRQVSRQFMAVGWRSVGTPGTRTERSGGPRALVQLTAQKCWCAAHMPPASTSSKPPPLMRQPCSTQSHSAHLCDLECHPVLLAQLLQLSHDAVCDAGRALGIQAVQHALHKVNLQPAGGNSGQWVRARSRTTHDVLSLVVPTCAAGQGGSRCHDEEGPRCFGLVKRLVGATRPRVLLMTRAACLPCS